MDRYGRSFHDQRTDESDDAYRIRKSNEYVKSIGAKAYDDRAPDARVDPEGSAKWMRENRPTQEVKRMTDNALKLRYVIEVTTNRIPCRVDSNGQFFVAEEKAAKLLTALKDADFSFAARNNLERETGVRLISVETVE